jgi:5'-nucleotidase
MKKIILSIIALAAVINISAQDLTVLHLNDTHSHIEPERMGDINGHGGIIEQAVYISEVREEMGRKNVLLLHAGDFSQGTSYFTELKGQMEIDNLNAIGYDVVTLGNHEFDNGIEALAKRLEQLNCAVVCANYDFSGTPIADLVKPYAIVKKAGKKIGVIGVLTDVSTVVDKSINQGMVYHDPVPVVQKYVDHLRNVKGCDLIICLTHLGDEPGKSKGVVIDQDLVAGTVGVDIVVGGHAHTELDDMEVWKNAAGEDVIYVTDGSWGLEVGRLDITF